MLPPALVAVALALLASAPAASAAPFGFGKPLFVNDSGALAGGEPVLATDPVHHTIVYSSHEGTTHIYRNNLPAETTFLFLGSYRNQVNNWTSSDGGKTWQQVSLNGTGFTNPPNENTGFSDPDLTQDAGGRIYNTGIDLVNDALFSSADGGKTWDRGTAQCHDGDRPWLAGAGKDEVYLATNTNSGGHQIFASHDGGSTCSSTGIRDSGGNGKMIYDPVHDALVEPVTSGGTLGVGVSRRESDGTFKVFRQFKPFRPTGGIYAHWPSIALDDAGGLYLTYDDDPVQAGTKGGCNSGPTPAPNTIHLAYSPDLGAHWNTPITVAAPASNRVLWPWVTAGDKGNANVVWYQTNNLADLACQKADMSAYSATVLGADTASPQVFTANVAGRPISLDNNICQSGTTCVATGEDRRLGDFFTNGVDERGCVMVATADTTSPDPVTGMGRPIALPLFAKQTSGPALRGGGDCSGEQADFGFPPSTPGTAPGAGGFGNPGGSGGSSAGSGSRTCVSARSFRIRLRAPKGDKLRSVVIYVAGKRKLALQGKKLTAPVSLKGLPKGVFTVRVQAVGTSGKRYVDLRTYRTCTPKRKTKAKKHTLKPPKKKS
jgi:hypothetical protein